MKKTLLIVESAAKCKTSSSIQGPGFITVAYYWYIKNLPRNRLGIDATQNFLPEIEVLCVKKEHIEKLRLHTENASHIFIAADTDRKSEVVAGHLAKLLHLQKSRFNHIRSRFPGWTRNDPILASRKVRWIIVRLWAYEMSATLHFIVKREMNRAIQKACLLRNIAAGLHLIGDKRTIARFFCHFANTFVLLTKFLNNNSNRMTKQIVQNIIAVTFEKLQLIDGYRQVCSGFLCMSSSRLCMRKASNIKMQ